MKEDRFWDNLISWALNIFAFIFILPIMGITHLLKRIISDVGKKLYANFIAFVAMAIFVYLLSLLLS